MTTPSPARRACRLLARGVIATCLVLGLALAGALALGLRPLAVRSGSMQPALGVGALVLDRDVPAGTLRPGQVVTFRSASRGGALVTHRVVAVRRTGSVLAVTTRGDANSGSEQWTVPVTGHLGRVALTVPQLGRLLLAPRRWYALLAVLVLTVLAAAPLVRLLVGDPAPSGARSALP